MRTTIQRNVQKAVCSTLLLLSALGASGQGAFQNLGFEDTTLLPILVNDLSGFYITNATIPGWSWSPHFNAGYTDPNTTVTLNTIALDAPAVTLHGADDRADPALSGNYSVLLQGGSMFINPQSAGASIFQTGQVPSTAESLIFLGTGSLQVTFNAHSLSPIILESTPSYTEWGVDISPYAGQTGELRFAVVWEMRSMLDGIQFSPNPIPEPSALSLSVFGFVLVAAITRRAKRSRRPTPGESLQPRSSQVGPQEHEC